jgi:hypothetical protein
MIERLRAVALSSVVMLMGACPSLAEQVSNASVDVPVQITVLPYAALQFTTSPLLSLTVPPAGSTIPANEVRFNVAGNAYASLQAEPDAFMQVPDEGIMGRAVHSGSAIGYKVELRFPRLGVLGSPIGYAALPGFEKGPKTPLKVDLRATGGVRAGEIHMEASPSWTEHGGLALPGVHVGEIVLTLTASAS